MGIRDVDKRQNIAFNTEIYEIPNDMDLEKQNAVMENALIEARYSLTLEEQRLVLATIAMLDNVEIAPSGFPMLRIPKKLIIEVTRVHKKNYSQIKTALRRLMQRVIEIETIESDGRRRFRLYQWFAKADYIEGGSFIEVQFHPDLKPYLLELKKKFTKIPLLHILSLRSKYAIRLYELLKRYEDTGFRTDYLPDLKVKLGIKKNEYAIFRDFERRVLKVAVKEINEKTDLEVSYKKKKTGRKITHIEFVIKLKPDKKEFKEEEKIIEKIKRLSEITDDKYYTPKTQKTSPKTLDNQGFYKDTQKELEGITKRESFAKETDTNESKMVNSKMSKSKKTFKEVWNTIGSYRKQYKTFLSDIVPELKRLNENQILFLLINTDESLIPLKHLKEIILNADKNKALNNPMGFLIRQLDIDIDNAKFKELTLTASKIDEEIFKEKLNELLISGQSAIKYIKEFWNTRVKGKVKKTDAILLRDPLRKAVYDDLENKIYIPLPNDEIYKHWFEFNWMDELRKFMLENFDIEDIELILV